jgi:hypothetical protein
MDHSKARAIYTRKSSEEGLEQDFNSLQAQREACEAPSGPPAQNRSRGTTYSPPPKLADLDISNQPRLYTVAARRTS